MQNLNKQQYRYRLLSLVDNGFYPAWKAAQELEISERQVRRLLQRFRQGKRCLKTILPKPRPPAWNGTTLAITEEIIRLKREKPNRSNQYIAEFIENKLGQKISSSTVRKILIRNDCYEKVKREHRIFKKLEDEITYSGQMLQMDTSEGAWLSGYRRVYLIAIMDAFSRYIVGWQWVDSDSAWNNILVLRSVIEKYGVPNLLYTDNASFFKVIRHGRSIYQKHKPDDEYETTIQRIMLDLGSIMVNHKPYEPQGKGRLERFFAFMQGRFIKEHTATNLEGLNKQFKIWVNWYNNKHVIRTINCVPKDRLNPQRFKPVPEDLDLDKVFSYQYTRKVDKYNGFSFEGNNYLIDKKNCGSRGCLVAYKVELYVTPKTIIVYHQNQLVQKFKRLPKKEKSKTNSN